MSIVVLAEKPSVAEDIAKMLNITKKKQHIGTAEI